MKGCYNFTSSNITNNINLVKDVSRNDQSDQEQIGSSNPVKMKSVVKFKTKLSPEHYNLNGYMNFSSLCEKEPEAKQGQNISCTGSKCKQQSKYNIDHCCLNDEVSKLIQIESNNPVPSTSSAVNRMLIKQEVNYFNNSSAEPTSNRKRRVSHKDISENKQNLNEISMKNKESTGKIK